MGGWWGRQVIGTEYQKPRSNEGDYFGWNEGFGGTLYAGSKVDLACTMVSRF